MKTIWFDVNKLGYKRKYPTHDVYIGPAIEVNKDILDYLKIINFPKLTEKLYIIAVNKYTISLICIEDAGIYYRYDWGFWDNREKYADNEIFYILRDYASKYGI